MHRSLLLATTSLLCAVCSGSSVLSVYTPDASASALDVRVSENGTYAYLLTSSGLEVLDVSDAASVTLLGEAETNGSFSRLAISLETIYAISSTHVLVVDVSDPSAPSNLCSWAHNVTANSTPSAGVIENTLLLQGSTIWGFDVSTPCEPIKTEVSHSLCGLGVKAFAVVETQAYTVAETGVDLFELATKDDLDFVKTTYGMLPATAEYLGVSEMGAGRTAFFSFAGSVRGIAAYDVSSLAEPYLVEHLLPTVRCFGSDVLENTLFVATTEGLHLVDLSDPCRPVVQDAPFRVLPLSLGSNDESPVDKMQTHGTHLFTMSETEIFVVDVEDLGAYQVFPQISSSGAFRSFAVREELLFTVEDEGLSIYNMSDLVHPVLMVFVADVTADSTANATLIDIAVTDSTIYLLTSEDRVIILSYTDSSTTVLSEYWSPIPLTQIVLSEMDSILYLVPEGQDMESLNVSDVASPMLLPTSLIWAETIEAVVQNDFLYVAEKDVMESRLAIFDRFEGLGRVSAAMVMGVVRGVAAVGWRCYVVTEDSLFVFNVTNPVNPVLMQKVLGEFSNATTVAADYRGVAYVATDSDIVIIAPPVVATSSPPTSSPPTAAPTSPPTSVPQTTAPSTEAPATNAPVETSQIWCATDKSCARFGDSAAICFSGNCLCSDGFGPSGGARVCVADGTSAGTVSALFSFTFTSGCDVYQVSFLALFIEAVAAAIGISMTTSASSCGSVTLRGVVDGITLEALATNKAGDVLAERYVSDSRYAAMRDALGTPVVSTNMLDECVAGNGVEVAAYTADGSCGATACKAGFVLSGGVCEGDASDNGDDDWLPMVIVGAVLGTLVCIAALVLFGGMEPSRGNENAKENENEPAFNA